jgi:hypothetical protein
MTGMRPTSTADGWVSPAACARCHSDEVALKVRADTTALTCQACGNEWVVKRMPLDAEASAILTRARQTRLAARFNAPSESRDSKVARHHDTPTAIPGFARAAQGR